MEIGEAVGSYRIVRRIGSGGMGTVYLAEHELIGRQAAIKVLHPHLCVRSDQVNRFFNEAKTTSAIHHAGILDVFDFGWHPSGVAYIVMEYLEGESLEDRIQRRGCLQGNEALLITRQIAGALIAAHDHGVVHRDLKPENIILVPDAEVVGGERIKILDFGIAKLLNDTSITRTGALIGTPDYMAPEQCRGSGEIDHRVDLYAVGCILYRMVLGQPPFSGGGIGETITAHLLDPPTRPGDLDPNIDEHLEKLILHLLEKQREQRLGSAEVLIHEIDVLAASNPSLSTASIEALGKRRTRTPGPSTISSAAMEVPAPSEEIRSALRWLAMAATLCVALAGAGYGYYGLGMGLEDEQASATPQGASAIASKRSHRPSPKGGEPSVAVDESSETPALRPNQRVKIALTSTPTGADVYRAADGIKIGTTPYHYDLAPVEGELIYIIRHPRRANQTVRIRADHSSTQHIVLRPRRLGSKASNLPTANARASAEATETSPPREEPKSGEKSDEPSPSIAPSEDVISSDDDPAIDIRSARSEPTAADNTSENDDENAAAATPKSETSSESTAKPGKKDAAARRGNSRKKRSPSAKKRNRRRGKKSPPKNNEDRIFDPFE